MNGDSHGAADPYQRVRQALSRIRLVEGLVHKQAMRQHDRVELLVGRQGRAELAKLVLPLQDREIVALLAEFADDDQLALWSLLPAERADDVLLELPDDLRARLIARAPLVPGTAHRHVSAFARVDGKLVQWIIDGPDAFDRHPPLWIDLIAPRPTERAWVERFLGTDLPDPEASSDLETSARYFMDDDGVLHLRSDFLISESSASRSVRVAFLLRSNCLISIRREELPAFRLLRVRNLAYAGHIESAVDLLLDLYAADVEYSANAIEEVDAILERVGESVLGGTLSDEAARNLLADIGRQQTLNVRIRRNLMDSRRALSYLARARRLGGRRSESSAQIARDIDSLNGHNAFLSEKLNFLLDAIVGFINLSQNRRVSRLTLFGVIFIPLNVLVGIGGMSEFSMMTRDVAWPAAYGALTAALAFAGGLTYLWVRRLEQRRADPPITTASLAKFRAPRSWLRRAGD